MNKKTVALFSLTGILLVSLSACGAAGGSASLEGGTWVLQSYGKALPIEGRPVTLTFEEGQVSGSGGCNQYGGQYTLEGDTITFGPLFMTEMFCQEPEGIMDQESAYLQFLGEAQRFEIVDGQLQVYRSDGEALVFSPAQTP